MKGAAGTTHVLTDIEGSTRLVQQLGRAAYAEELARHRRVLRAAFGAGGGVEVEMLGDGFHFAFDDADAAVAAAVEARDGIRAERWVSQPLQPRIGMHTGDSAPDGPVFVGVGIHLAARVMAAGHGGRILVTAATNDARMRPGGASPTIYRGRHRLKDIEGPVPIFEVAPDPDPPPLRTLGRPAIAADVAPIGRDVELRDLRALVRERAGHLISLVGPGGVGKTTLARALAQDVQSEFEDGAVFVDVTAAKPEDVLPAIAAELGLQPGEPDVLGRDLRPLHVLVVIDNFESVSEAAPLLLPLLGGFRGAVVVTTRERLRLRAEIVYDVRPLSLASRGGDASDAAALFERHARAKGVDGSVLRSERDAVETLCRRLDGIPLAIELAAATVRFVRPAQLVEQLDAQLGALDREVDRPARHVTIERAVAWSFDRLEPELQPRFLALGAFVGGFGLDAAREVAGLSLADLAGLADRSLLRLADGRALLLEPVRLFAVARLDWSGVGDSVRDAHLAWAVAFAETLDAQFDSTLDPVARFAEDHANLLAALEWGRATDVEAAFRLATACSWYWVLSDQLRQGLPVLEDLLPRRLTPDALRAQALLRTGTLAEKLGRWDDAERLYRESFDLRTALGDEAGALRALNNLGSVQFLRPDYPRARAVLTESYARAVEMGSALDQASAACNLGFAAHGEGDVVQAAERFAVAVELARELGHEYGLLISLEGLAAAAFAAGDTATAVAATREGLDGAVRAPRRAALGGPLENLSGLLAGAGEAVWGARLFGFAMSLGDTREEVRLPLDREITARYRQALERELGTEGFAREAESGTALSDEQAVSAALELVERLEAHALA